MNNDLEDAYIITYEIKGRIYIRMFKPERNGPATVQAFKTEQDGLDFYEKSYAEAHRRGTTWSTGAIIMDMQLQPRVHRVTISQIKSFVGPEPHLHTFSGEAVHGDMGIQCLDNAEVRAFREAGKSPSLVRGV
jgi:hypothetical protein